MKSGTLDLRRLCGSERRRGYPFGVGSGSDGPFLKTVLIILGILLAGTGGLIAFASYRWRSGTAAVLHRMWKGAFNPQSTRFNGADLEGLPQPVARYFNAVLRNEQPGVRRARLKQHGHFLLRSTPDDWRPFAATQDIVTNPAGFVWDARIRMGPGLNVHVRDSLVDGVGSMLAALLGLVPLVAVKGRPEIAAGALHRYLAESVWFPTALLPSHGVIWTALNDSSARASLSVGATTVSLDFHFGADRLVHRVFTSARARQVESRFVLTPWQGRFTDYEERGGMFIPTVAEVEWLLPEGSQLYWRGRITEADYEFVLPESSN